MRCEHEISNVIFKYHLADEDLAEQKNVSPPFMPINVDTKKFNMTPIAPKTLPHGK